MFTGIIETLAKITDIKSDGSNKSFWLESDITNELKVDESVSHDGVCLTVEEVNDKSYKVTAIKETLEVTNLKEWKVGGLVNIERSLKMNGRLDGHMVQGHVDATGICINKEELDGSTEYTFSFKKKFGNLVIEKGSICVNGISLTAFNIKKKRFTVAIIPYTLELTNLSQVREGSMVNLEFDILGKYILKSISLKKL